MAVSAVACPQGEWPAAVFYLFGHPCCTPMPSEGCRTMVGNLLIFQLIRWGNFGLSKPSPPRLHALRVVNPRTTCRLLLGRPSTERLYTNTILDTSDDHKFVFFSDFLWKWSHLRPQWVTFQIPVQPRPFPCSRNPRVHLASLSYANNALTKTVTEFKGSGVQRFRTSGGHDRPAATQRRRIKTVSASATVRQTMLRNNITN
jgi:hypothetical protein